MKVIMTGATGNIGSHTLKAVLSSEKITSVIALSRRPLDVQHPKLTTIIQKDFNSYPDSLLEQLSGAEAGLWCMGAFTADQDLNHDFPLAFARAWATKLPEKKMRFVFLSGALREKDLVTKMMKKEEAIRVKVWAENDLYAFAQENEKWQSVIAKPAQVLERGLNSRIMVAIGGKNWAIYVDDLGRALADLAADSALKGSHTVSNNELIQRGKQ